MPFKNLLDSLKRILLELQSKLDDPRADFAGAFLSATQQLCHVLTLYKVEFTAFVATGKTAEEMEAFKIAKKIYKKFGDKALGENTVITLVDWFSEVARLKKYLRADPAWKKIIHQREQEKLRHEIRYFVLRVFLEEYELKSSITSALPDLPMGMITPEYTKAIAVALGKMVKSKAKIMEGALMPLLTAESYLQDCSKESEELGDSSHGKAALLAGMQGLMRMYPNFPAVVLAAMRLQSGKISRILRRNPETLETGISHLMSACDTFANAERARREMVTMSARHLVPDAENARVSAISQDVQNITDETYLVKAAQAFIDGRYHLLRLHQCVAAARLSADDQRAIILAQEFFNRSRNELEREVEGDMAGQFAAIYDELWRKFGLSVIDGDGFVPASDVAASAATKEVPLITAAGSVEVDKGKDPAVAGSASERAAPMEVDKGEGPVVAGNVSERAVPIESKEPSPAASMAAASAPESTSAKEVPKEKEPALSAVPDKQEEKPVMFGAETAAVAPALQESRRVSKSVSVTLSPHDLQVSQDIGSFQDECERIGGEKNLGLMNNLCVRWQEWEKKVQPYQVDNQELRADVQSTHDVIFASYYLFLLAEYTKKTERLDQAEWKKVHEARGFFYPQESAVQPLVTQPFITTFNKLWKQLQNKAPIATGMSDELARILSKRKAKEGPPVSTPTNGR